MGNKIKMKFKTVEMIEKGIVSLILKDSNFEISIRLNETDLRTLKSLIDRFDLEN